MTPDLALSIGLFAGWLALIVQLTWPSSHWCHDETCKRLRHERGAAKDQSGRP